MRATEVRRIRPSGIMPIIAATVVGTASSTGTCRVRNSRRKSSRPRGTRKRLIHLTRRFRSVISSDFGERMRRASPMSRAAQLSSPTAASWAVTFPSVRKEPDMSQSPGPRWMGSLSPVSRLSSALPAPSRTTASAGTWSPARSTTL